ncbi:MAG TPA: ribosome maturation factor RimP [Actinomycetota bacterium]
MTRLEEHLRSLVEPVLARRDAELVDLVVRLGRNRLVRVVADRPGGIDLDTCAEVNKELGRMLDADDPIEGTYTLEVTSPGLDRPLRGEADFAKNAGRRVRIVFEAGQVEGVVATVEDGLVRLEGVEEPIRLGDIRAARLVLPW